MPDEEPKASEARDPVRCSICGCKSSLVAFFVVDKHGNRRCPRCFAKERERMQRQTYLSLGLVGLGYVLLAALISEGRWSVVYLSANLLLFLLCLPLIIVLHELAHASGAWLMRGRVFALYFGYGLGIRERRIGQVTVAAQPLPLMGFCVAGFHSPRRILGRTAVYIAAPLLMHTLILLALIPSFQLNQLGTAIAWSEVFLIVNLLVLAGNLIPRQLPAAPKPLSTDGMWLLRLASGQVKVDELHKSYFLSAMLFAYKARDYDQTVQASNEGLAIYPGQPYLRNGLAAGLISLKDYEAALPILRELLDQDEGVTDDVRTLALNNLAFAALENGASGPELDEALDNARTAYGLAPWMPQLRNTLGAVLVAQGEAVEGLANLTAAWPELETDDSRAYNLGNQALAKWQQEDRDGAHVLLRRAVQLDPSGNTLVRIKAQLASEGLAG